MLKDKNSEILIIGKKLRHEILFDIPQEIDHLQFFKHKFLNEQLLINQLDKIVYKKYK